MGCAMNSQKGFGLLEALASMFILALLATAVMTMNYTNHQAALRISTRNEATLIAQRVMDSLQVLGVSRVRSDSLDVTGDSTKTVGAKFNRRYRWVARVEDVTTTTGPTGIEVTSIRAKKVNLTVRWTLANRENSITLTTVVE